MLARSPLTSAFRVRLEPVLTRISPQAMELRGFERRKGADGTYSVIQEWDGKLP